MLPRSEGATVEQAACGGEDFELLAAIDPAATVPATVPVTVVGRLVEGSGLRLVDPDGVTADLHGWDHFA